MLITLTAKIFSGSHTKESARMRRKTDNPIPETAQAPLASPELASPAPTFYLGDWMPLRDAVLEIISRVGGKRDPGLGLINRYLHSGQLGLALIAPDGTPMVFSRTDCEHRTIHAPLIPAEGVRVEPYEAGQYLVRRADFDKLTSPATPATPADRQLYAEGRSEPAARTEESTPEPAPTAEPPRRYVSEKDLRDAIISLREWIAEPGRREKEITERVEGIVGCPVSRDRIRVEVKAQVPEKNRSPGRPRKQ